MMRMIAPNFLAHERKREKEREEVKENMEKFERRRRKIYRDKELKDILIFKNWT